MRPNIFRKQYKRSLLHMKDVTNSANEGELVEVNILPAQIKTSDTFTTKLQEIKELVKKSKDENDKFEKLLQDPNSELDEDALAENVKQQADAQAFIKESLSIRKNIVSTYNNERDKVATFYDDVLKDAGFSELTKEADRSKKFKKDAQAHRVNKRWEELKITFDANLAIYPQITDKTPNLARFSTFRLNHPKLVTGAKAYKITDRIRGEINNEIANYAQTIDLIQTNPFSLSDHHVIEMLRQFENRPDPSLVTGWGNSFKSQEQAEERRIAEAARVKVEQEKALKLQQQKLADEQAKAKANPTPTTPTTANAGATTPVTQPVVNSADPYAWLADYILTNPKYSQFKTNNLMKLNLILDLINQMQDKSSPVMQNVKSPDDMITVLHYVLD